MLEVFFAIMAAGMNSAAAAPSAEAAVSPATPPAVTTPSAGTAQVAPPASTVEIAPDSVTIGQGVVVEGTAAQPTPEFNMQVVPAGLTADAQVPTGTFTTAVEIRPILDATKGNWVAVREFDGQDLLYITHLWSWRCGLKAIAISLNGEAMQNWPMPACHEGSATPNAILPEDGLPYLKLRLGSVRNIKVQIVYDDLSMDVAEYDRNGALLP